MQEKKLLLIKQVVQNAVNAIINVIIQNDKNKNTSALNETSTEIKASEKQQNSSAETKKVGDDKVETDKVTDEKTDKKDIE